MRVLIVDRNDPSSRSLRALCQEQPDMSLVGHATTVEHALHQAQYADVVLLNAPGAAQDAFELTRELVGRYPHLKVLVLGVGDDARAIVKCVEAGAVGYVGQDDSRDVLLEKVRAARQNRAVVSPDVAAHLITRLAELTSLQANLRATIDLQERSFDELTPREEEVLSLLSRGMSNQEIAEQLVIAHGTVKNHVHHILRKLNAANRHEAAAAHMLRPKRADSRSELAI